MVDTLLPCPFCGLGQSQVDPWFDYMAQRWRVGCGCCGASTGISPQDKGRDVAIAAWNRRNPSLASSDQEAARETANFMARHIVGRDFAANDETCIAACLELIIAEREACANIVDEIDKGEDSWRLLETLAERIRKRSER